MELKGSRPVLSARTQLRLYSNCWGLGCSLVSLVHDLRNALGVVVKSYYHGEPGPGLEGAIVPLRELESKKYWSGLGSVFLGSMKIFDHRL